jgi:hypothetical protein
MAISGVWIIEVAVRLSLHGEAVKECPITKSTHHRRNLGHIKLILLAHLSQVAKPLS